jgi:hypothetical protein
MYKVILNHDGIERTYPCEYHFDAVVLFHALIKCYTSATVESWRGDTLDQRYDAR